MIPLAKPGIACKRMKNCAVVIVRRVKAVNSWVTFRTLPVDMDIIAKQANAARLAHTETPFAGTFSHKSHLANQERYLQIVSVLE